MSNLVTVKMVLFECVRFLFCHVLLCFHHIHTHERVVLQPVDRYKVTQFVYRCVQGQCVAVLFQSQDPSTYLTSLDVKPALFALRLP